MAEKLTADEKICECEKYACYKFGPNSIETVNEFGKTVQIAKNEVKSCIRKEPKKKK